MKTRSLSVCRRWLAVLGGGFLGAVTRYLLSAILQAVWGTTWPADILVINLSGAFVLALVTMVADTTTLIGPTRRLFISVGVLGAYTTFSSLALGDVLLLGQEHWLAASLYLVLSVPGGILMALLGDSTGRWLVQKRRHAVVLSQTRQPGSALPSVHGLDAAALAGSGDEADQLLLADTPIEREMGRSR
jgi:CrcB protein